MKRLTQKGHSNTHYLITLILGLVAWLTIPDVHAGESQPGSPAPNDPQFTNQWNLERIGAPLAWATTTGSTNIVVALFDTGIDYTHPDLAANMWRNPGETGLDPNGQDKATNGIDDDGNGYVDDVYGIDAINHDSDPMDDHNHGTGAAGIIGAVGNNAIGVAGINWTTQIMALRHEDNAFHWGESLTLEALEYVIQMKRRGVNIRVASHSWNGINSQAVKDAIDTMGNLGILNVFLAGNEGVSTPLYPGGYDSPSIINVTGSTKIEGLAGNYGRPHVHLAAPAINSPTTALGGGYCSYGGTSGACPHVAGAAALLLAAKPDLSVAELKAALLGTVDVFPAFTNKVVSHGRLNLGRAMQFLIDSNAPPLVTSALPSGRGASALDPIDLTFTKPMDRGSVEAGFSLKPAVAGRLEWSNNDRTLRFVPAAPLGITNYTGRLLGSASDLSGLTLDANCNRLAERTPLDDFIWTFGVAAANDNFAHAELISGPSGSVTGTNVNATKEFGEPKHAQKANNSSIWYRWTAPGGASVTFDATATKLDTVLAVYTGERLEALTPVASNDNYGARPGSRVTFLPTPGTTYFIALGDKGYAETGVVPLSWYPTPPPVFSSYAEFTPSEGEWKSSVDLYGTNFTGVTSVLFDGVSATFTNISDLRIKALVPLGAGSGLIKIQTPQGNVTSMSRFGAQSMVFYSVSSAEPALWIDWAGNGFVLECADSLAPPVWQPVNSLPTPVEGSTRQVLTLPCEGAARFFRWQRD